MPPKKGGAKPAPPPPPDPIAAPAAAKIPPAAKAAAPAPPPKVHPPAKAPAPPAKAKAPPPSEGSVCPKEAALYVQNVFGKNAPKPRPPPPLAKPAAPMDPEFDMIELVADQEAMYGKGCEALSAREKILLINIDRNLRSLWNGVKKGETRVKPDLKEEFKALTGFRYTTMAKWSAKAKEENGFVVEPENRGKKKAPRVEDQYPDFKEWLDWRAHRATMGVGLTLAAIQDEWCQRSGERLSKNRLRDGLYRLGFRYRRRTQQYISKKYNAENLGKLREYCEWVEASTVQGTNDDGSPGLWNYRYASPATHAPRHTTG